LKDLCHIVATSIVGMAVPETVDQPSSELQDQQPVEPVKPPADNDTILLPGPTPDDRPSDAEILLQQNEIRAEVAKLPYVGPKEPMDSLKKGNSLKAS
jgi:hypothetical protein